MSKAQPKGKATDAGGAPQTVDVSSVSTPTKILADERTNSVIVVGGKSST